MLNYFRFSFTAIAFSIMNFSTINCSELVTITTEHEEINFILPKSKNDDSSAFSIPSNIENNLHLFSIQSIPDDQDVLNDFLKKVTIVTRETCYSNRPSEIVTYENELKVRNLNVSHSKNEQGLENISVYFTTIDPERNEGDLELTDYKATFIIGKKRYLVLVTPFEQDSCYDNMDEMKNNLFQEHDSLIDTLVMKFKD